MKPFYILVYNPKHIMIHEVHKLIEEIELYTKGKALSITHHDDDDSPIYMINSEDVYKSRATENNIQPPDVETKVEK